MQEKTNHLIIKILTTVQILEISKEPWRYLSNLIFHTHNLIPRVR